MEIRRLLTDTPAPVTTDPVTPEPATVVGAVFRDANGDGVHQSTETGQAGVKVFLDYNGNGSRDGDAEPIATTNSSGQYEFDNVQTGAAVEIRLLLTGTNLVQTLPKENGPRTVTPVAGEKKEAELFGVTEPVTPPPPTTTATLNGTVFRDSNGNGTQETTETGQANIKVFLDYNGNGTRDGDAEPIATTGADGKYHFEKVTPETNLDVRLLLTGTNFVQTHPADNAPRIVTVAAGQTLQVESFGVNEATVVPPVVTTLSGLVYTDGNRNGKQDGSETGRANVKVYIDTNHDGSHEDGEPIATTNSTGTYRFEKVEAGDVTIRLLLTGTTLLQTDPAKNEPVIATVVTGKANVAPHPFGVAEPIKTATITGNVFYDHNGNAVRDSGDGGRGSVRVYLDLNNDNKRDNDEPNVLSKSNGAYKIEKVPVSAEIHVRLDLTGTHLTQTYPKKNASHAFKTEAGKTYTDENFGVREVAATPAKAAVASALPTGISIGIGQSIFAADAPILA